MLPDILRLGLGLFLAAFHRPVADFILQQEYVLASAFRQRGILVPGPLTTEGQRTLYFFLGILLALVAMARIWLSLNPEAALWLLSLL